MDKVVSKDLQVLEILVELAKKQNINEAQDPY